jgi:predicted transcriptional regulator
MSQYRLNLFIPHEHAKRLDELAAKKGVSKSSIVAAALASWLSLFVRYFLTVSTPVPEAHQDAARAQGKARFEQFVEQLGRHLMRGRSLVRDVVDELHPDTSHLDDAAALAEAQERAS